MTICVLSVWWDGRLVGQLTQNQHGELGFAYSPDWLQSVDAPPLSASLPKHEKPFSRRECRPFFGGLLPEESQRDAAARALGVSRGNDFALLDRLGGDVAGALQLLPPGEMPTAPHHQQPTPLDDAGLIRVLDALPLRPLLAGEDGLRLSLAGAQSKVPVILVGLRQGGSVSEPALQTTSPDLSRRTGGPSEISRYPAREVSKSPWRHQTRGRRGRFRGAAYSVQTRPGGQRRGDCRSLSAGGREDRGALGRFPACSRNFCEPERHVLSAWSL